MSIVEQCIARAANAAQDYAVAERGAEIAFVEFARLAQAPEMVERLARAIALANGNSAEDWESMRKTRREEWREEVRYNLAALFREAGVSGGGG